MAVVSHLPRPPRPGTPKKPVVTGQSAQPTTGGPALAFVTQPTKGGSYHVYPGGRRVFVAAKQPMPTYTDTTKHPAPATPSAGSAQAAANVNVLDAQYEGEQANHIASANKRREQLQADDTLDESNYTEALRRLAGNETEAQRNRGISDYHAGLADTGTGASNVQRLTDSFTQQRADALQGLTGRQSDRTRERGAVNQGLLDQETTSRGDAAGRHVAADTATAAAGGLAATPENPAAAAPPFKVARSPSGNIVHVYPSGRKVVLNKKAKR